MSDKYVKKEIRKNLVAVLFQRRIEDKKCLQAGFVATAFLMDFSHVL